MIFLTVGTTEPFDRLVSAMDNIAVTMPEVSVLAQISNASYLIRNMQIVGFISPLLYDELFDKASLIVSHAGMGTILSALYKGKPIIVMPRKVALGEHHSDHQVATAKKLEALNYVQVAHDEEQLLQLIKKTFSQKHSTVPSIGNYASDNLIKSLKDFINE